MQEEIFGPILPVLEVDNVQQVIDFVNERPSPLGLYVFAEDISRCRSGSSGLDHLRGRSAGQRLHDLNRSIPDLPFGGVGNSGMGKYHGEWGFRVTYTERAFSASFTTARGS